MVEHADRNAMKIFQCEHCQSIVYFENTICLQCGHALGFNSSYARLYSMKNQGQAWSLIPDDGQLYRYCTNHQHQACNWLVPIGDPSPFCKACRLNRTIPNLEQKENLDAWRLLEQAKHRLVYGLQRLELPVISKTSQNQHGLAFDFLSAVGQTVRTGHANGVITINLAEADTIHREWIRKKMSEPYRTLIGHFRHEIGHYYWELLILHDPEKLQEFRLIFGDEKQNYNAALQQYYEKGAPSHWQQAYISAYATAHPWEDWAESWAHYLHIMDTVETGYAFGIRLQPDLTNNTMLNQEAVFDPYEQKDFNKIFELFIPMTFAIDSFNRGMGLPDVYPFVVAPPVKEKLTFIHDLIRDYPKTSMK